MAPQDGLEPACTSAQIARLNHPTRRRMLEAAETRFAADGYDAARVDDIAATAGVSKSHLYYHFASKAELLKALVDLRVAELLAVKDRLMAGLDVGGVMSDQGALAGLLHRMLTEVLEPRRAFLRIVLVEAIRNPSAARPVFRALDTVLDDTVVRLSAVPCHDPARIRSLWLHFGIIPTLYLIALGDDSDDHPPVDLNALSLDLALVEGALLATLAGGPTGNPHGKAALP